jgi:FAD/FMN-containing dehydrogenase
LINIVGKEWVSDDPAVTYSYARTFVSDAMRAAMPERRPSFVVCPGSVEEIREIMRIANKRRAHVQVMGGGQGLGQIMWGLRKAHGIMLDCKRMAFFEVDEANRNATAYCGAYLASLSGEWRRRLEKGIGELMRPYYTGGPGQGNTVASTILGGQKFGLWKHAVAWFTTCGAQNVFPDGTLLETGSRAVASVPEFWPYGPGPTLHFMLSALGGNTAANYGVITRLTFKLFQIPEVMDGLYAFYEDYDGAVEALEQLAHREIGRGVFVGCDWTMSSYSADGRVNSIRLSRASPLVQLGVAFWGTKRRVEYESKTFMEIVKKTGGRIMPREFMCIWRGHNFNILGWAQSNSPREYRQLGAMGSFPVYNVPEIESVKKYLTWCKTFLHTPSYVDHPVYGKNVGIYSSGLQIYPHQFGRGSSYEYIWSYDIQDKRPTGAGMAIFFNAHRIGLDTGVEPGRSSPEMEKCSGPLYDLMKKIKEEFDPNETTGM